MVYIDSSKGNNMAYKSLLWVPQYSNYSAAGEFILEADSNWQLVVMKLPEMIKVNPDLVVRVIAPTKYTKSPYKLLSSSFPKWQEFDIDLIPTEIACNAPQTRYDFDFNHWALRCKTVLGKEYTHVYANDPMLVRHLRAVFSLNKTLKTQPRFVVNTHFLDTPAQPLVPTDISYWHGTVEGCIKSDQVIWHSKSMQDQWLEAANKDYRHHVINDILKKSTIWKDGYLQAQASAPPNMNNVRFDTKALLACGKKIVWVPNRVGGLGKSFDYTNNGKFLFEIVPELWKIRQDFVVIAGNPSQKISNDEIAELCPAFQKLVDGPMNLDEYYWLSQNCDIVVALYTIDTNGGLAALESIESKAVPLFPDVFEYKHYFDSVAWPEALRINPDLSHAHVVLSNLLNTFGSNDIESKRLELQKFVRSYASYEETVRPAMESMGLLKD
jgi:hypothetical protein